QVALRLGLAFGLVIALLIGIGDLGVHRMDRINADLQDIMGREWVKLRLTGEAVTFSNRNSDITMQMFLLTDREQVKTLLKMRTENANRISALVASLEALCETDEEKQLLTGVKRARKRYADSHAQVVHLLLDEKNREEAVAIMVRETTPAL